MAHGGNSAQALVAVASGRGIGRRKSLRMAGTSPAKEPNPIVFPVCEGYLQHLVRPDNVGFYDTS